MRGLVLCCGAGGASEGFRQAGFPASVVVDTWDLALKSHALNHPDAEHVEGDVRQMVESLGRFDWVQASPPCPDWSMVGKRGINADTSIMKACLAIIEAARPKWYVIENVPGAAGPLMQMGQPVHFIRANDHGLNHKRERVFSGRFVVPMPTRPAPALFTTMCASDGKRGANGRIYKDGPANSFRDYLGHVPSSAEYQEAMGFPSGYQFAGNKKQRIRQIGNAVCPPVARAIGQAQRLMGRAQMMLEVAA